MAITQECSSCIKRILEAAPHKTAAVRSPTTHHENCWRSKDELISDIRLWTLHMKKQRQDDKLEPRYNCSVSRQDIAWKTSLERWTIETGCERGSERSVLAARHDDDDVLDI